MRDDITTEDQKIAVTDSTIDYANISVAYEIGVPDDLSEDAQRETARDAARDLFQFQFSEKPGLRSTITAEKSGLMGPEPNEKQWKVTVVAQLSSTAAKEPYGDGEP